jgi:hypothetical protein
MTAQLVGAEYIGLSSGAYSKDQLVSKGFDESKIYSTINDIVSYF